MSRQLFFFSSIRNQKIVFWHVRARPFYVCWVFAEYEWRLWLGEEMFGGWFSMKHQSLTLIKWYNIHIKEYIIKTLEFYEKMILLVTFPYFLSNDDWWCPGGNLKSKYKSLIYSASSRPSHTSPRSISSFIFLSSLISDHIIRDQTIW